MRTSKRASRWGSAGAICLGVVLLTSACGSGGGSAAKGGSSAGTGTSPAAGSTINIGVLGAYSGATAASADGARDGVLAWVKSVNDSGGINGHPIKAFVEDDKGDPAASTQALRTLVETDHVVALVGPYAQGTDATWGSYLQAHNVPVVGGASASDVWTTNPMYFGAAPGQVVKAQSFLLGPKAAGATKNFAMYCTEVGSCADVANLTKSYAAKLGVEWGGQLAVSATSANYAAVCLQAKNSGATAVTSALPPATFDRVVAACHQQGFDPIYAVNSGGLTSTSLKTPSLNGLFAYLASFPVDSPAAVGYLAAMSKYFPSDDLSGNTGQIGWTAGALFQAALKNVPASATVTSADVVDGLNSIKDNDLGGLLPQPITFQKGTPHAPQTCVFTAHLKDQKLVTDSKPLCAQDS